MLALWTAVTLVLWLFLAYSKAYSAMRSLACSVMSLILCTTPSTIWKDRWPGESQEIVTDVFCFVFFNCKLFYNLSKCGVWCSESHHMLDPTVFSFSVLPDGNQVHISVWGFVALDGHARSHISIQVKGFPQQQVHRWMASSYWCLQRTCKMSMLHAD